MDKDNEDDDKVRDKDNEKAHDDEENSGEDHSDKQEHSYEEEKEENQRSGILEIAFTIASSGMLLFLVGYLVVQIFQDSAPPGFRLTPSEPRPRGAFTAVGITVENTGDEAAKHVHVRGEAPTADEPFQAEATLDWLPGNSRRQITLLFPAEADLDDLNVDVIGYEEP